jgi:3-phosphoshikimate 1-carboxyvinyltransferase
VPAVSIRPVERFNASLSVPGDKSISHRALFFSALATGQSHLSGLATSADVASTARCLRQLGVQMEQQPDVTLVTGVGLHGLQAPADPLDCGNSGTTLRLLMGILAGQPFASTLIGDASLSRRPMRRVADPLRQMGARLELQADQFPPVQLLPAHLSGLDYRLPVASAQLKSALLLAGLWASAPVCLRGELGSRDHSERLLPHFGVHLTHTSESLQIVPGQSLSAADLKIPGDPSSAAFWLAAAAMTPGAGLELTEVCLNPTRLGFVRVLERMGADVSLQHTQTEPEPVGQIRLRQRPLQGVSVSPTEIPDLIDEIPMLAVLATAATGRTEVRGAAELRVKESDRLAALAENLRAMGVALTLFEDGFALEGPQTLHGATIDPHHDHRIAMAFAIAGLNATGETRIEHPECVGISYPSFFSVLEKLHTGGLPPCNF